MQLNYVCMYEGTYIRRYLGMYVCMHACLCARARARAGVCVCVCLCLCLSLSLSLPLSLSLYYLDVHFDCLVFMERGT